MTAHHVAADPVVHNRVVVPHDVIIHHSAVLVDIPGAVRVQDMVGQPAVAETACWNPCVIVVVVSKAKVETNVTSPVAEPNPSPHIASRRRRRPSAIIPRTPPRHPAR